MYCSAFKKMMTTETRGPSFIDMARGQMSRERSSSAYEGAQPHHVAGRSVVALGCRSDPHACARPATDSRGEIRIRTGSPLVDFESIVALMRSNLPCPARPY